MSSQPNEKGREMPEALVQERLRREGLPVDARVKVNLVRTRVRVNPDGTRTIISQSNMLRRRPAKWSAVICAAIGLVQLSYGVWAARSDRMAAPLFHASPSCELARISSAQLSDTSLSATTLTAASSAPVCRIEPAIVVRRYTTSSRNVTHYHVATVTAEGRRDETAVVGHHATQLWNRLRPTERITLQRFILPGYHLSGDIVALADSVGAAMSRNHPDAGTRYNAVNVLLGALFLGTGLALFTSARRSRAA